MSEPVFTSETPPATPPASGDIQPAAEIQPPPEGAGQPEPEVFDKSYVEKLRKENASYRTRAQENAKAAERLKEIEDRDLSELQKAQRDREEALTRLASIEQDALRYRVASQFSISKEDADEWLIGADEEAVTRKAQRFLELRGNVSPAAPRPDLGQGPRPSTPQAEMDAEYAQFEQKLFPGLK